MPPACPLLKGGVICGQQTPTAQVPYGWTSSEAILPRLRAESSVPAVSRTRAYPRNHEQTAASKGPPVAPLADVQVRSGGADRSLEDVRPRPAGAGCRARAVWDRVRAEIAGWRCRQAVVDRGSFPCGLCVEKRNPLARAVGRWRRVCSDLRTVLRRPPSWARGPELRPPEIPGKGSLAERESVNYLFACLR